MREVKAAAATPAQAHGRREEAAAAAPAQARGRREEAAAGRCRLTVSPFTASPVVDP
uniref:Uncharacterized protein n=1 Tax=Oryza sativa subsp. japonica TaxID=39947 RepID=Q5ZA65_ORYSJ|nr:hypothetical protein [Oryza sativa Japonica Group]